MSETVFATIDYKTPEARAYEASKLFVTDILCAKDVLKPTAEEISERAEGIILNSVGDPEDRVWYSLSRGEELIAAATAKHGLVREAFGYKQELPTVRMEYFAVSPEKRRNGYGQQLLRGIATAAMQRGEAQIEIVAASGEDVSRFWLANGFGWTSDYSLNHEMRSASMDHVLVGVQPFPDDQPR